MVYCVANSRIFLLSWLLVQTILYTLSTATYSPQLKVYFCSLSKVVVNVTGALDGGIIYIRGNGAACQQDTTEGSNLYEFQFEACGINELEQFTIIIQRNPLYQTGDDLEKPVQCVYATSIMVGNMDVISDSVAGQGINKTVQPTGKMKLYKNGVDVSASVVQLGDELTMTVQLDSEFTYDFDLRAKHCTANTIQTIYQYCPTDTSLFPSFQSQEQGLITATFQAFRSTELNGGAVEMAFSCTMEICQGPCNTATCNETQTTGRRKRSAVEVATLRRNRRDTLQDDKKVDDVNVGTTLKIGTSGELSTDRDIFLALCLGTILTIAIGGAFLLLVLLLFCVSAILLRENAYLKGVTVMEALKLWRYRRKDNKNTSVISYKPPFIGNFNVTRKDNKPVC